MNRSYLFPKLLEDISWQSLTEYLPGIRQVLKYLKKKNHQMLVPSRFPWRYTPLHTWGSGPFIAFFSHAFCVIQKNEFWVPRSYIFSTFFIFKSSKWGWYFNYYLLIASAEMQWHDIGEDLGTCFPKWKQQLFSQKSKHVSISSWSVI